VRTLLHQSDCFVLSSKVETFGVVLIEAMSCGLPVLSTKCGGPESIVTGPDLGLLCDQDELSNALHQIAKAAFNKDRIRNYVMEHFSSGSIASQLKAIYFEIRK